MPTYPYYCSCGNQFEEVRPLRKHRPLALCRLCGKWARQYLTPPVMVVAQPECRYTSPIDDTPITSWAARRNDLDKHNCVPYDPEQKTDYLRRQQESQAKLDKAIDTTVEAAIEKMPTKQRGKLYSELTEQGATVNVARGTL